MIELVKEKNPSLAALLVPIGMQNFFIEQTELIEKHGFNRPPSRGSESIFNDKESLLSSPDHKGSSAQGFFVNTKD